MKKIMILVLMMITMSFASELKDGSYICYESGTQKALKFTFSKGQLAMNMLPLMPYVEIPRDSYLLIRVNSPITGLRVIPAKFIIEHGELIELADDEVEDSKMLCITVKD